MSTACPCTGDVILFSPCVWQWVDEVLQYVKMEPWFQRCECCNLWKHWLVLVEYVEWCIVVGVLFARGSGDTFLQHCPSKWKWC